jgi:hypothetical protein
MAWRRAPDERHSHRGAPRGFAGRNRARGSRRILAIIGWLRALAAIGSTEALEALAGVLDQPSSPTEVDDRAGAAVEAVFKLDPTSAFDRLIRHLDEPGLSTPTGRQRKRPP